MMIKKKRNLQYYINIRQVQRNTKQETQKRTQFMRFVYDLSSIHLTTWLQAGYRTFIEVVGLGLLSKMVPQWLIPLNQEYHTFH